MVFLRYDMNLRQVLKKFGRGIGINMDALRVYAAQLLAALRQLRHLGIVHVSRQLCPCPCELRLLLSAHTLPSIA